MCEACENALVRIMAEKVLERRVAVATASEADRPPRQRDLAAAERALSMIEPRDPRPQARCSFEPWIIETEARRPLFTSASLRVEISAAESPRRPE
jgi:hypothetical protein